MLLELTNGGQAVDRIAGEPADRFCDDQINSTGQSILDHTVEAFAVLCIGAGDAFIRVHFNEFPFFPALDVVGVIVNLCLVTGKLFIAISGNAGIASDPSFGGLKNGLCSEAVNSCRDCSDRRHLAGPPFCAGRIA